MELTNIGIESFSSKDNLCLLDNISSSISDRALDEVLKRALEKTCNIESPANKKQKKESWDFCEPAKVVVWPPPSAIESAKKKTITCLEGLMEDSRRAKIANMLQKATDMAKAVGKLDPEAEPCQNGRRRFQRRNSFVIHRNRKIAGAIPAPSPSTTNIAYPLNVMRKEADGALGLHPDESNLFFYA
jgi:hypothetical protein